MFHAINLFGFTPTKQHLNFAQKNKNKTKLMGGRVEMKKKYISNSFQKIKNFLFCPSAHLSFLFLLRRLVLVHSRIERMLNYYAFHMSHNFTRKFSLKIIVSLNSTIAHQNGRELKSLMLENMKNKCESLSWITARSVDRINWIMVGVCSPSIGDERGVFTCSIPTLNEWDIQV